MAKLNKGPLRLFEFLKTKKVGDHVSLNELMEATFWDESSIKTYMAKNKLTPFLALVSVGRFRVLKGSDSISEDHVKSAFTQVRPKELTLSPGDKLAGFKHNYKLISKLGEGAIGHVWKAEVVLSALPPVAIKVMLPRLDLLEPSRIGIIKERFRRESENGSKLKNPNVIKINDQGIWDGEPFLVMQLAERSVADILDEKKNLSIAETFQIINASAKGLLYLHEQNCIHRDIKPENILQFGSSFVLGDLGIVKWSDMNRAFTSAATITRASLQLGSWYYMAPEQSADPHEATTESDVYSLGVTWYQLLTNITPSPAQIAAQKYQMPSSNEELNSLIRKMLAFEREARPSVTDIINFTKADLV